MLFDMTITTFLSGDQKTKVIKTSYIDSFVCLFKFTGSHKISKSLK